MQQDLTKGSVTGAMLRFALPMILGNLLQQLYNVTDTLIVGQALGANALAAVGSAYTLMTFLTSILLGLCLGSGAFFSLCFGARDEERLRRGVFASFVLIGAVSLVLNAAVYAFIDPILRFLRIPSAVYDMMRGYLLVIFAGIVATFLYNFFASLLRAMGNSSAPLLFLAVSAVLNIALDLDVYKRQAEGRLAGHRPRARGRNHSQSGLPEIRLSTLRQRRRRVFARLGHGGG